VQHIAFLIHILAFAAGAASITVALLFYLQYRRVVIVYYALLLVVIALILAGRMLLLYAALAAMGHDGGVALVARIIEKSAYALGVFVAPYFTCDLIGVSLTRFRKRVFGLLGAFYLAITLVELSGTDASVSDFVRLWLSVPLLFGVYLYHLVLGAVYLGRLGSRELNVALKLFFVMSVLVLPVAFLQYVRERPFLPYYAENAASFLLLSVLSIVFSFRYFNQPPYFSEDHLSEHYKKKFSVTAREADIISLLLSGSTNAEIAEKSFISPRTVESHLYNIFQKTGVRNRVQLINLIQTNRT
jgi:DNA-binding CsgD family transcriptional regulator